MKLDSLDKKILSLIQKDSSMSTSQIADQVNLSQPPCWRRIKRLEDNNIILRRIGVLNHLKLGFNIVIYAEVKLTANRELSAFEDEVQEIPEVTECYVMLGRVDFLLRIVTTDMEAYQLLYRERLSRLPDVAEITSSVAMGEIKRSEKLPLQLI